MHVIINLNLILQARFDEIPHPVIQFCYLAYNMTALAYYNYSDVFDYLAGDVRLWASKLDTYHDPLKVRRDIISLDILPGMKTYLTHETDILLDNKNIWEKKTGDFVNRMIP